MTGKLQLPISLKAQEAVDRLFEDFTAEATKGDEDGHAMKQLVYDIGWEIHKDRGGKCREEADQITAKLLAEADLPPDLAYLEGLLKRLEEVPTRAYQYIEQRRTSESARNRDAARQPRRSSDDWWSGHIEDCLDDDPEAKPYDVKRYLLETGEVNELNGVLRRTSGTVDPLSKDALRSRIRTAKRRMRREG